MWLKELRRLLRRFDEEKDAYLIRQLYIIAFKHLEEQHRLPRGEWHKMRRLYQSTSPAEAGNP